jgi:DNA polymerase-3 subunit alpha
MENGVKPVYRLTTGSGRSIEATANHPFLTPEGWRWLGELKPGDRIAAPRRYPQMGKIAWPEHEVIALGHLLAEGNLCHPHSVYYYNQDRAQVADFVGAAERFPNVKCSVGMHKGTFSVYARRENRAEPPGIFTWAERLGLLGRNARNKEIPAAAFELVNPQIALLLSRMWQGDGHIDLRGRSLFYATASGRLAHQVQHLLLRLGIVSRIREVEFPYKEGRKGYQVFVTGNEHLAAFARQIGPHFLSQSDRATLEQLVLAAPSVQIGTKDIVPLSVKGLVRRAKERSGMTWREINRASGIAQREFYPTATASKVGYSHTTISRLAVFFDDPALRRWADNDIYWDSVERIEYSGEKQTYDLEVPETHNFVANDIIVHNSHAADYGVIAVQTAYLKSHYTVEYMTALLSASKNETEKVAFYVADCRAMGISVLPPDVTASGWDFTIEDLPDGKPAIRFGLGAVKNVGQAPVELILQARKDAPFKDLTDFAHRVDLRQVGKRAMECLVRVGGLDRFGPRTALLEALDRILSVSTSYFKAALSGQMSFFGADSGVTEEISLPAAVAVDRRELLNWERDLIGLYVSDHPLTPYMAFLQKRVTHFSGQLGDVASKKDKVCVAGMVVRVRQHQTKNGKAMGFATLEDLQGNLELVVFPSTWEKSGRLFEADKVLAVEGKVDAESGDPKILVDNVEEITEETLKANAVAAQAAPPLARQQVTPPTKTAPAPAAAGQTHAVAEISPVWDDEGVPPPPDVDDWDMLPPPGLESAEWAASSKPASQTAAAPAAPARPVLSAPAAPVPQPRAEVHLEVMETRSDPPARVDPLPVPPAYILSPTPLVSRQADRDDQPKMVTILLRSSGDKERDVRRLRCIHGALVSCPGKDRFAIHIFEGGRGYLLEFPNESTGAGPDLMSKLIKFTSEENIRIDPIPLQ